MATIKKHFLSIFILLLVNNVVAKDNHVSPDAGMWNTFSLEKKINKKFSISFDEELRIKENFSKLNLFYTNIGINYKINKKFKVSLIYRNAQKSVESRGWDIKHRIMFDASFKQKLSKSLVFQFRERIQFENKNIYSSKNGRYIESFSRSKFSLAYNVNDKLKVYATEEIRFQIIDPRNPETNFGIHRFRHALGFDYDITPNSSFGLYYLIQNESKIFEPNELYILGVEYSISL